MNPDFLGSVSTGLTWKNLSFRMALDMRFGGKVAVYGNRYDTAYGWTESSLKFRDEAHGRYDMDQPIFKCGWKSIRKLRCYLS